MTFSRALTAALLASLAPSPVAIAPSALYGTWRLVSYTSAVTATGERADVYGRSPVGILSYGTDGRMSAILGDGSRPKPPDLMKVTDEERLVLYRTMIAYAGTFTLDGATVTHHVEISLNQTWTGTHQVRHLSFNGDTLVIRTDAQPRSIDGKVAINELKWVKVGAGQRSPGPLETGRK